MKIASKTKSAATPKPHLSAGLVDVAAADDLQLWAEKDVPDGQIVARSLLSPIPRHSILAATFGVRYSGGKPPLMDRIAVLTGEVEKASNGDMAMASQILASQAISLDAMFAELARRAGDCMGKYPDAMDRYMRLALKAQANSRATLEALAKLHQPREQTVRHVHVNEGGQAVIADQFHNHTGDRANGKSVDQSDATGPAGASAALPGPDASGNGLPIPSGEGETALSDARRD